MVDCNFSTSFINLSIPHKKPKLALHELKRYKLWAKGGEKKDTNFLIMRQQHALNG